jgi:atypical dual specificity phosphatase
MERFYWVVPNLLAGASRPGARRASSDRQALRDDLDFLSDQVIAAIISLTESSLDLQVIDEYGFDCLHLPVIDFTPPSAAQIRTALDFIDGHLTAQRPVVVHCAAGQGRAATMLAAYLIREGRTPDEAVTQLRVVCDRAVENELQLAALAAFADERGWLL